MSLTNSGTEKGWISTYRGCCSLTKKERVARFPNEMSLDRPASEPRKSCGTKRKKIEKDDNDDDDDNLKTEGEDDVKRDEASIISDKTKSKSDHAE